MRTTSLLKILALAGVLYSAMANCPNACSGHGTCGANDACTCYRNWQAADCSQRTCPFDYAHITTPQGDLNMDGDRKDNSLKPLSQTVATLNALSDLVTFSGNLAAGEISAGDGIMIEGLKFIVASHTSGSAQLTLDSVHTPGKLQTAPTAYRYLSTDARPFGSWEVWPGDYSTNDEGHFYMECSNRGLCDRKAGTCNCFDGYAGQACQRTVCPNDCSGHGTCEYVSELRSMMPNTISTCTVEGTRGAFVLTTSADCGSGIAANDYLKVGDYNVALKVASKSATAITLSDVIPKDFPYGTPIALQPTYQLWDADKHRACRCDPRYEGYDCSERKCPRGDDPLSPSQVWETQVINIGGADPANVVKGSFKLVFTDKYGEMWTTSAIPVDGVTDNSATVKTALTALPNDVIQDVTVTFLAINDKAPRYHVTFNGGTTVTSTGNAGDLPLMGCDASALKIQLLTQVGNTGDGLDNPAAGTGITSITGANVQATTTGTDTTVTLGSPYYIAGSITDLGDGDTVQIGNEMRVLSGNFGAVANNSVSFTVDRAFSQFSSATDIARLGTAATDYTRTVKFKATVPGVAALVVGDILNIASSEERTIESVTISGSTVTDATVTSAWTTQGYPLTTKQLYTVRYSFGVDCTVTDQARMMPSTWAAAYVTGEVGTQAGQNIQATGPSTLTATVSGASATTVTLSGAYDNTIGATSLQDGDTVKIGTELRRLSGNGGLVANAATTFTVDRAFTAVTGAAITRVSTQAMDATRRLTLSAAVSSTALSIGDKILIKTAAGSAAEQVVTVTKITTTAIDVEEQMDYHAAGSVVYRDGRGTKELAVCSNRGLCDSGSGECKCFKGYTFDDCSRQNALAS